LGVRVGVDKVRVLIRVMIGVRVGARVGLVFRLWLG